MTTPVKVYLTVRTQPTELCLVPTASVQLNKTERKKQIKKDSYKEESLRHSFPAKKRRKGNYTLPLVRILGLTQCPTSLQLNLLRLNPAALAHAG